MRKAIPAVVAVAAVTALSLYLLLAPPTGSVARADTGDGTATPTDPLPSWNDGPNKQAILDFVARITKEGGPDYVRPSERIATFDNDGTLWPEQPAYTQLVFVIDRVIGQAPKHPQWKLQPPYSVVLSKDKAAMSKLTLKDIEQMVDETHTGMTVEQFRAEVKAWLAKAKSPHFKKPYTQLAYRPMLEVMNYLRLNGFKVYIVTGGGQEFVRAFAEGVYGVPPEQVVGSSTKTKYEIGKDGSPALVKTASGLMVCDKTGKPECIGLMIGRTPIAAFGNSDGDRQMLEYAQGDRTGARLMMLVHHDDAEREFSYGPKSKIGTFSDDLAEEAKARKWNVISMKNDWKTIFAE